MTDPYARTPQGLFDRILQRIGSLEERIGRLPARLLPGGSDVMSGHSGATAERDAIYGVPATNAERVALANRKVTWFNTDLGWEESYYATTGLSGLTARGLVAGTASGWYPVGRGPIGVLHGAAQAQSSGDAFINYYAFGTNKSYRNAPASIVDRTGPSSERLSMNMAGRWRTSCRVSTPPGSGTGVASLVLNDAAGAQLDIEQRPYPLLSGYGQHVVHEIGPRVCPAGSYIAFVTNAASWTITVEFLLAEYLGPALVTV